jgi:hypothetical protein
MSDPDFAAAIAAAFQAFNERRFADFATYVTDDVVEICPQSGERFEARDNQQAFHEAFPNPCSPFAMCSDRASASPEVDERRTRGLHDRLLPPTLPSPRLAPPVSRRAHSPVVNACRI